MRLRWESVLALAGVLFLSSSARAESGLRYTTVFEESVDGEKQPASAAESTVMSAMMRAGLAFVDEAQSRKIRSLTNTAALMNGEVSKVITSFDADVILAAVITVSNVPEGKGGLLKGKMSRFDASIEARVIAVDTARVLGVFQARGSGLEFSAEQAAKTAARKAGELLASQVLEMNTAQAKVRPIELTISGVPSVTLAKQILDSITAIAGVKSAKMLESSRGVTKIGVELEGMAAQDLALALDAAHSAGLIVFGYSENAIKAEFSSARSARFPMVIDQMSFAAGSKGKASWEAGVFRSLLRTELANLGFIALGPDDPSSKPLGKKATDLQAALRKLNIPFERALVLSGTLARLSGEMVVEARVVAASSGGIVLAKSERCPQNELSTCARMLGDAFRASLFQELETKQSLFKGGKVELAPLPSKPLQISGIDATEVYPARLTYYAEHAIGQVTLKNGGTDRLEDLRIATEVVGFTRAPTEKSLADLSSKASIQAPLNVVLDKDAFVHHDENLPAVLRIKLSYRVGEYRFEEVRTAPLVIYDRHALSWKDGDSVAAFITHRSPGVLDLAKSVRAAIPNTLGSEPLAMPMGLFRALGSLRYSPDPVNPFGASALDYVQFPLETFARRGGDCDDLAVAFTALAEAAGVETLLVTTPEHVFVAVQTGLPARNANLISLDPDAVLTHRSQAWVPIETTKVGRSFAEAWDAARDLLKAERARGRSPGIIDVRNAWTKYGPIDLSSPSGGTAIDPAQSRVLEEEAQGLAKRRADALAAALSSIEQRIAKDGSSAELLNQKGVILAAGGRFDEARAIFKSSAAKTARPIRELNNLGNVGLIEARSKEALEDYERALTHAPKQPQIHLNAAIAAWSLGDEQKFGDHIARCLHFGGHELVEELGRSGVSSSGQLRSADEAGRNKRSLAEAIVRELEKAGATSSRAKSETRAEGQTDRSEWGVSGFVYWL